MASYEDRLNKAHNDVLEAHRAIQRALGTLQSISVSTADTRLRRSAGAAAVELDRVSLNRAAEHIEDAMVDADALRRW